MHILKLKSSKFYVKIIGSMQILGTTPLNLQENIKAFKEIEAIDKEVAKALPQEINENDRGHYVVALVKQQDNPVKKK